MMLSSGNLCGNFIRILLTASDPSASSSLTATEFLSMLARASTTSTDSTDDRTLPSTPEIAVLPGSCHLVSLSHFIQTRASVSANRMCPLFLQCCLCRRFKRPRSSTRRTAALAVSTASYLLLLTQTRCPSNARRAASPCHLSTWTRTRRSASSALLYVVCLCPLRRTRREKK